MAKELLFSLTKNDFVIETMRGHGAGGQHRNVTESAVRITHPPSGASAYAQRERSQHTNKKHAFKQLINSPKFKLWLVVKYQEVITGRTLEQEVEKSMCAENIKTEYQVGNKWVEESK